MRRPRFGLTILELVVATFAVAVIAGILVPLIVQPSCRVCGGVLKDKTQVKMIHQAMLVFAEDNEGRLPLPGLIDPLIAADGPVEDVSLNHSAPLFSSMIAMQLINTAVVISPHKVNWRVEEMQNYNFDACEPLAGVYWDPAFAVRIDRDKPGSNNSYAHMSLCGDRKERSWRDASDSNCPMLSTRGPRDGALEGVEYTKSLTLQLVGPNDAWAGNVVFGDNHVEYIDSIELQALANVLLARSRNLFRMDGGALGVSVASTAADVTRVWDPQVE